MQVGNVEVTDHFGCTGVAKASNDLSISDHLAIHNKIRYQLSNKFPLIKNLERLLLFHLLNSSYINVLFFFSCYPCNPWSILLYAPETHCVAGQAGI